MTTITEDIKQRTIEAFKGIFATRGKNKGQLLAKAPPMNSDAYAAWMGAMMSVNPYKVSIIGACLMTPEQSEIMRISTAIFDKTRGAHLLDRDRAALEALGAW